MSVDGAPPSAEDKARYENARKELIQALQKKRTVDKQLALLEVQLYNFEGSYLTETTAHSGGNIIQGFDAYLKTQSVGRRRHEVTEADRMFSNSSLTYQKSLELVGEGDDSDPERSGSVVPPNHYNHHSAITIPSASRNGTPGLQTVILSPAPRSHEMNAATTKKLRDKEYQRRKRAQAKAQQEETGDDEPTMGSASGSASGRKLTKRQRTADDD